MPTITYRLSIRLRLRRRQQSNNNNHNSHRLLKHHQRNRQRNGIYSRCSRQSPYPKIRPKKRPNNNCCNINSKHFVFNIVNGNSSSSNNSNTIMFPTKMNWNTLQRWRWILFQISQMRDSNVLFSATENSGQSQERAKVLHSNVGQYHSKKIRQLQCNGPQRKCPE